MTDTLAGLLYISLGAMGMFQSVSPTVQYVPCFACTALMVEGWILLLN